MANTRVSIVIRTRIDGVRRWCVATGTTKDPVGSFYLRYCDGSKPKCVNRLDPGEAPFTSYDTAYIGKMKLERRLKALATGNVPAAPVIETQKLHRITDCINAYITDISRPDKNGDVKSGKNIRSRRSELERFATWSRKTYIEELTPTLIANWRDEMNAVYEPDTVYNKLMQVTTWWKKNPLVPHDKALLSVAEFPDKKNTIPDPYTEVEFNAMLRAADYETGLLLYFFATTGMREQEVAFAEREDINWELGDLHIVKKKAKGFLGKTPAALRQIPLDDVLLDELRLRGPGLLFPSATGHVEGHFLRKIADVAKAAGVVPTTQKPHMIAAGMVKDDWCHRFRDTFITNSLHLHCKNSMAELLSLCQKVGHSDTTTMNKYFGKLKTPYVPQLRLRKATKVVEITNVA